MKKKILLLISIALAAMLAGCGSDQYAIERQYWRIQKQAEKIFRNPQASPPNELQRVVNTLAGFSQKYPKSNFAVDSEFNIARLYIVKEEYNKARAQLKTIINKYSKSEPICSVAVFLLGNSYQIQDNWNSALEQYKKIIQDYPATLKALDVPIYIAQYYKIKYQPDKMLAAFKEAIAQYRALAGRYPDSPLAYSADSLAAQCYIELKDWQNAINSFNSIIEKYKDKVNLDRVFIEIAVIYSRELKDKAKAKEALERMIKEYPKSRLIKTAQALLKELEKK